MKLSRRYTPCFEASRVLLTPSCVRCLKRREQWIEEQRRRFRAAVEAARKEQSR